MATLSTKTKILTVWGCLGRWMHIVSGQDLLKAGKGYTCPHCGSLVFDVSKTPVGKEFFKNHVIPPPPRT